MRTNPMRTTYSPGATSCAPCVRNTTHTHHVNMCAPFRMAGVLLLREAVFARNTHTFNEAACGMTQIRVGARWMLAAALGICELARMCPSYPHRDSLGRRIRLALACVRVLLAAGCCDHRVTHTHTHTMDAWTTISRASPHHPTSNRVVGGHAYLSVRRRCVCAESPQALGA